MTQFPFDKKPSFPTNLQGTAGNKKQAQQMLQNGQAHQRRGQFKEAELCYQLVLRDDPDNAEALNLLGTLVNEAEQYQMSIEFLEKAVKLQPKSPKFRNNLANSYILNEQPELAVPHLRKALARQPGLIEALMNMTRAHREMGKWQTALDYCRKARQLKPDFLPARIAEAGVINDAGDNAKAAEFFRQILKDEPISVEAMTGLAAARKFTTEDQDIAIFEAAIDSGNLDNEELIAVLHAAGKYYNDIKDYDAAFPKFAKAKELAGLNFKITDYRDHIDRMAQSFTSLYFLKYKGSGSPSDRPVFIVGMPRSGTTLTEQIIASHPKAFGAGELNDIGVMTKEITRSSLDQEQHVKNLQGVSMPQTVQYAERYLATLSRHSRTALRVVDKMPHNFQALGLIALLFPNAYIIHCRRDPMDNCMSILTHHFSQAHGYNTSLETLGLYYREYKRLMEHWKTALPLKVFDVQYEQMIADQEAVTRQLIEFLDLEWDDACLEFHKTERSVQTFSKWQVRQPIYSTSIKRWKHYDKHLGPLKSALGDLFVDD